MSKRNTEALASGLPPVLPTDKKGVEKLRSALGAQDRITPLAAASFLVNACMGMGFLTLPYAFARAGIVASSAVVIVMAVLSVLGSMWQIDAMARVNAIRSKNSSGLLSSSETSRLRSLTMTPRADASPFELSGGLDIATCCEVLYGPAAERAFVLLLCLTLGVTLWGFSALVGSTLADLDMLDGLAISGQASCNIYVHPDQCFPRYRFFLVCFGVVGVLLTVLELKEQTWFQLAMTFGRTLIVAILIGDSLRMLASHEAPPPPTQTTVGAPDPANVLETDWTHLLQVAAIASFSLGLHLVLPDVLSELDDRRANALPATLVAQSFCAFTYVATGCLVAFTFGHWTLPICTLNWANARLGGVQEALMILPTLDLLSAFPLWAHCLALNLHTFAKYRFPEVPLAAWRVFCAIVPLIGSFFVYDVTLHVTWAGVIFTAFIFIMPILLWWRASALSAELFTPQQLETNPYRVDSYQSTVRIAFLLGLVLVAVSLTGAILNNEGAEEIKGGFTRKAEVLVRTRAPES